ncbi:MAG: flavodoxin family protein [Spirochaetia bacterium]|jgi:flavodoxin|nr:flavodoxin family protein [Spirochaetia bacterium]
MKVLIIYDSVFDNTEQIAQAISKALDSPNDIKIIRISDVKQEILKGLDILIIGSPTRAFKPTKAITDFLKRIPKNSLKGVKVATFDTRFTMVKIKSSFFMLPLLVNIFGYASNSIAERLKKKGGDIVASPVGFFVDDVEGPLKEGEIERAANWVKKIF